MKKFRLWAIVATITLFLTVFSAGKVFAVADEAKETEEEMLVEGLPWNADVVTETTEPLKFENITAKEVIVEGGNAGVVRINGGNIDRVTVKAAEVEEFGFKEIVEMIAAGVPISEVVEMYQDNQKAKENANALKPTVKVVGGAEIDELVVSGSAVLDMSTGYVDKVTIQPAVDSGRVLVTIKNYDGNVNVVQTPNTDGSNSILNVELKNSNLAELNVDGEKKCVFHIGGDKNSDVAAMSVEGSSDVVTMVDTAEVKVAEGAEKASVRIYSDIENLVVEADNSYLYVAASAVVENAKVEGDNVTVGYNGRVENSEVTGNGSQVVYQAPPTATPSPTPSPKPSGTVIGNENNSTGWWTAHSEIVKVEEGETEKVSFYNFTGGGENWHNFLVVLQNVADAHGTADNAAYKEYAVLRADNYGWCGLLNPHANNDQLKWVLESNWNWDTFKSDMNGAKVDVTVTNNGTTADVVANITTESGKKYFQSYKNIAIDGDLYFCLTVEGGHLIIPKADAPVEPEQPVEPEAPKLVALPKAEDCSAAITEIIEDVNDKDEQYVTLKYKDGTEETHTMIWDEDSEEYIIVYLVAYADGSDQGGDYKVSDMPEEAPKVGDVPYPKEEEEPAKTVIGTEDGKTGWWGAHSDTIKVEKGTSKTVVFKNYGGALNWNNFVVVLQNIADVHAWTETNGYKEYAVVRADNCGWGWFDGVWCNDIDATLPNIPTNGKACSWNWDTLVADMSDATVELTVSNYGTTADIVANVTTAAGATYFQKYTGITVDGELYYCLTVDNCYLVIEEVKDAVKLPEAIPTPEPTKNILGAEDFSTGWWSVFTEGVKVEAGESETVTFKNYTKGALNHQNYVVILKNVAGNSDAAGYSEYAVVRPDHYGWLYTQNTNQHLDALGWTLESNWVWGTDGATFRSDMNGATVELTITNHGTTADVVANITTANGEERFQKFLNIKVDGDLYYSLSVENAYLVFE